MKCITKRTALTGVLINDEGKTHRLIRMCNLFGALIAKYLCNTSRSTLTGKCFHCSYTGLFKLKKDI